jgi:cellulose synthase/poly-beta-1,6-N-acetylglucosamine synthase-like glycosyltransferase
LFKQLYKDNHSFQISKNYFCVAGRGTWVSIVVSLPCTTSKQSTKKCITAAGLLVLQINMQLIILFSLLLFVLYASLIIYYRSGWIKIPTTSNLKPQTSNQTFISVIIPARNEEQNLPALLNGLKDQVYNKSLFEVIVVDDHSNRRHSWYSKTICFGNVKLIQLQQHVATTGINSYKKKAIEIAIAQSKGELIVTTDADCVVTKNWLKTIATFYEQNDPAFIVMPVKYEHSNNFLEIFQALDFMTLQGITGAAVSGKSQSMCNGANLAYTKKAFEAAGGFEGINNIASGDDMLLMHKIFKQNPAGTMYLKSSDVIVQTKAMYSWKDFFNQRIRWASKADKYDDKRIFWVLLIVYAFNVMLLVLPVVAAIKNYQLNYQLSIINF